MPQDHAPISPDPFALSVGPPRRQRLEHEAETLRIDALPIDPSGDTAHGCVRRQAPGAAVRGSVFFFCSSIRGGQAMTDERRGFSSLGLRLPSLLDARRREILRDEVPLGASAAIASSEEASRGGRRNGRALPARYHGVVEGGGAKSRSSRVGEIETFSKRMRIDRDGMGFSSESETPANFRQSFH